MRRSPYEHPLHTGEVLSSGTEHADQVEVHQPTAMTGDQTTSSRSVLQDGSGKHGPEQVQQNQASHVSTAQGQTVLQAPTSQGQTVHAPTSQGQTVQAPTSQGQTVQAPTSQGQTVQAPTSQGQTVQGPTSQGQTVQGPTCTSQGQSVQSPTLAPGQVPQGPTLAPGQGPVIPGQPPFVTYMCQFPYGYAPQYQTAGFMYQYPPSIQPPPANQPTFGAHHNFPLHSTPHAFYPVGPRPGTSAVQGGTWPPQGTPFIIPYPTTVQPYAGATPPQATPPQSTPPQGQDACLRNSWPQQLAEHQYDTPVSEADTEGLLPPPYDATSYQPSPVLVRDRMSIIHTNRSWGRDHFMAVSVTTTLICLLCATWSALLFTIPAIYCAWQSAEAERDGDIFRMRSTERSALAFNIAGIMFGLATWLVVMVTCIVFLT